MTILDPKLLQPIKHDKKDPFATMVFQMDVWVSLNLPEYRGTWQIVKGVLLRRILKLGGNTGSFLSGQGVSAPHHELCTAIQSMYDLVNSSVYYTSQFWRAYSSWLNTGEFDPRWPLFGRREARLASSILTSEEKDNLKNKVSEVDKDVFRDPKSVDKLVKYIEPKIKNMCMKKIKFIAQYDSAVSFEDLYQEVMCGIMVMLRNKDTFCDDLMENVGWVIKCAENTIHNLRSKSLRSKRDLVNKRDLPLDTSEEEEDTYFRIDDLLKLDLDCIVDRTESSIFLEELIQKADPKISTYLRAVCEDKYSSDFWAWFYHHEPVLAQRDAYREGHPEALGPYIQRHLGLPTWQLTGFLHEHLPDLKSKVKDTPRNKNLLRGAA